MTTCLHLDDELISGLLDDTMLLDVPDYVRVHNYDDLKLCMDLSFDKHEPRFVELALKTLSWRTKLPIERLKLFRHSGDIVAPCGEDLAADFFQSAAELSIKSGDRFVVRLDGPIMVPQKFQTPNALVHPCSNPITLHVALLGESSFVQMVCDDCAAPCFVDYALVRASRLLGVPVDGLRLCRSDDTIFLGEDLTDRRYESAADLRVRDGDHFVVCFSLPPKPSTLEPSDDDKRALQELLDTAHMPPLPPTPRKRRYVCTKPKQKTCPACGTKAGGNNTKVCRNSKCGHTFVSALAQKRLKLATPPV
jgi:hypothetical protein